MDKQIIVTLVMGLFFVILGFLVRRFPILIAGYNTMTKEQKEKIDIKGLARFMQICLSIIGLLMLLIGYLYWRRVILSSGDAFFYVFFVILAGSIIMVILAQKYDHNKKKKS